MAEGSSLFRLPSAVEQAFVRQFAATRRHGDARFLIIHCLVTLSYIATLPTLLSPAVLLALGASFLPALCYWAMPEEQKLRWRTLIVIVLKVCMLGFLQETLSKDFDTSPQPWPLFFFQLAFRARVIAFLAVGLGLQLPLSVDAPLQLLCVAALMRSAVPRQCQPGHAPPGLSTMFELDRDKFETIQGWLDWPFAALVNVSGALALSDAALCRAVFMWVQLVLAFGVPIMVLYNSERLARRNFLRARQQQQQEAGPSSQQGIADLEADPVEESASSAWTYFAFFAQTSWCIIRTIVKLTKK